MSNAMLVPRVVLHASERSICWLRSFEPNPDTADLYVNFFHRGTFDREVIWGLSLLVRLGPPAGRQPAIQHSVDHLCLNNRMLALSENVVIRFLRYQPEVTVHCCRPDYVIISQDHFDLVG